MMALQRLFPTAAWDRYGVPESGVWDLLLMKEKD